MNRTLNLIGIGKCDAHAAASIKVGDHLMWNYGYITRVVDVQPKGNSMITVTEVSLGWQGKDEATTTTTRDMTRARSVVKVVKVSEPWARWSVQETFAENA